jgi:hypothetical protein
MRRPELRLEVALKLVEGAALVSVRPAEELELRQPVTISRYEMEPQLVLHAAKRAARGCEVPTSHLAQSPPQQPAKLRHRNCPRHGDECVLQSEAYG